MNMPSEAGSRPILLWSLFAGASTLIAIMWLNGFQSEPPVSHLWRSTGFVLSLVCLLLIVFHPSVRRSCAMRLRIAGAILCLTGAAAFWWFMPTNLGASLWTAKADSLRIARQFESLAPRDVQVAAGLLREGKQLALQFPEVRAVWEPASRGWIRTAVAHFLEDFSSVQPGEFASFHAALVSRKTIQELWPEFGEQLREAEKLWREQTVKEAIVEADQVALNQPDLGIGLLQTLAKNLRTIPDSDDVQKELSVARRRVVDLWLEDLREKAFGLLKTNSYAEAAELVTSIDRSLRDEAHQTERTEELEQLQAGFHYLSRLSQMDSDRQRD